MTTVQRPYASKDVSGDIATGSGPQAAPPAGAPRPPRPDWRVRLRLAWPQALTVVLASMAFGVALHFVWFQLFASSGGDLAAQDAWAEFVGRHPGSAYNLAWYGGLHPVSYSIVSPYLMAVFGVRATLVAAGVLSSGLLAAILARTVHRPMVPALWGSFAFACNAASGRVTFALGVLFGLGAVATVWAWPKPWLRRQWRAMREGRRSWDRYARAATAIVLSALATAGSPVAGLFLEVVAAALLLGRRRAAAAALAVPPPLMVACSALFFPFQGDMPMPFVSLAFPVVGAVVVVLLVPKNWMAVRVGGAVYALGIMLTWLIPSQVGSNVERLGLLFGGVALLAAAPLVVGRTWRAWCSWKGVAMVAAFIVTAGWQIGKPTWDVVHTTPDASWARELAPLVHQLKQRDAARARVEVVPVNSHREASALAPYVNLARGWNRQADLDRNPLFYEKKLEADRYHDWLRRWAVHYVVLPSDDPDLTGGVAEARLVRGGQPFLREIWSDANWRLYRVTDAEPLAEPPADVKRADPEGVTLRVREPGPVTVRVPYSPWLSLLDRNGDRIRPRKDGENRDGCLREAAPTVGGPPPAGKDDPVLDTWTVLEAPRAGTYRIAAPYGLPRGTPCSDEDDDQYGSTSGSGAGGGDADGDSGPGGGARGGPAAPGSAGNG